MATANVTTTPLLLLETKSVQKKSFSMHSIEFVSANLFEGWLEQLNQSCFQGDVIGTIDPTKARYEHA
jgi:hypothetical protein